MFTAKTLEKNVFSEQLAKRVTACRALCFIERVGLGSSSFTTPLEGASCVLCHVACDACDDACDD